ncbi:MAG: hypothetical protein N0E44_20090 [Candidatus Thiodiazotropha lotti]|nr:hypothetical protein [Candidatus Thiodiazotropha lotti]MCW4222178.1 hypothetical protein [Candidatus Thiodiazotropha lotti]
MADFLFKIKLLWWFVDEAIRNWRNEVWQRDLDERYCCDGNECACGGVTVREMHEGIYDQYPPGRD